MKKTYWFVGVIALSLFVVSAAYAGDVIVINAKGMAKEVDMSGGRRVMPNDNDEVRVTITGSKYGDKIGDSQGDDDINGDGWIGRPDRGSTGSSRPRIDPSTIARVSRELQCSMEVQQCLIDQRCKEKPPREQKLCILQCESRKWTCLLLNVDPNVAATDEEPGNSCREIFSDNGYVGTVSTDDVSYFRCVASISIMREPDDSTAADEVIGVSTDNPRREFLCGQLEIYSSVKQYVTFKTSRYCGSTALFLDDVVSPWDFLDPFSDETRESKGSN
jgi:hypothetical protein